MKTPVNPKKINQQRPRSNQTRKDFNPIETSNPDRRNQSGHPQVNSRFTNYEKTPYDEQIKIKTARLVRIFQGVDIRPFILNPSPVHYRHKAVLSAFNIKDDHGFKIRLGMFVEHTKTITAMLSHLLHDPGIDRIFQTMEKLLLEFKIKAYHFRSGEGILKHVLIRKSFNYPEYMVVLATNSSLFPNHRNFVQKLVDKHPEIKTVIQNIHQRDTDLVIQEEERILYGNGYIFDKILDLKFKISAKAFYQVNPHALPLLYQSALDLAGITKDQVVLDCYSGIGTITLLAAQLASKAIGFEINESSHKDAIFNKRINNIENAFFHQGDVLELIKQVDFDVDCLLMDPTREGASEEFLLTVLKLMPKRIVYISCDPNTQVRDLKILEPGYLIKAVQPVDMFSYTSHIENIVLLERK